MPGDFDFRYYYDEPGEESEYSDEEDEEFESSDDEDEDYCHFADPGGRSALRRATRTNPRIFPCRNCGGENLLTAQDVALGYQCDSCADALERGW